MHAAHAVGAIGALLWPDLPQNVSSRRLVSKLFNKGVNPLSPVHAAHAAGVVGTPLRPDLPQNVCNTLLDALFQKLFNKYWRAKSLSPVHAAHAVGVVGTPLRPGEPQSVFGARFGATSLVADDREW